MSLGGKTFPPAAVLSPTPLIETTPRIGCHRHVCFNNDLLTTLSKLHWRSETHRSRPFHLTRCSLKMSWEWKLLTRCAKIRSSSVTGTRYLFEAIGTNIRRGHKIWYVLYSCKYRQLRPASSLQRSRGGSQHALWCPFASYLGSRRRGIIILLRNSTRKIF